MEVAKNMRIEDYELLTNILIICLVYIYICMYLYINICNENETCQKYLIVFAESTEHRPIFIKK